MTRQRFIHPEFWTDPSISKLTTHEKLMFIGMFSNADDEGILLGSPAYLRSTIFPYDDISNSKVKEMRDRIASICKNIVVYVVDEIEYIMFTKWSKYQNPRYPKASRHPKPPTNCDSTILPQACNQIDESLQPNSNQMVTVGKGMGLGMGLGMGMGKGMEGVETTPDPTPSPEIPYDEIVKAYNDTCTLMPKANRITTARRRAMSARWRDYGKGELQPFINLFRRASQSAFLNGENDRGWYADFDWLLNESNLTKVLEGKYDRAIRASPGKPVTQQEENSRILRRMYEDAIREEQANGDNEGSDDPTLKPDKRSFSEQQVPDNRQPGEFVGSLPRTL